MRFTDVSKREIMLELVNNTATAITFLTAMSLPVLTLFLLGESNEPKRKIQVQQHASILELPLVSEAYLQENLQKIENLNIELNGMIRVFSIPLPPQKGIHDTN